MDLEGSRAARRSDFQSVRPNPSQYKDNFEETNRDQNDYKEYAYKAGMDEETAKMKDSLNTIHDINDIKIKTSDVKVPDASGRWFWRLRAHY